MSFSIVLLMENHCQCFQQKINKSVLGIGRNAFAHASSSVLIFKKQTVRH